MWIKGGKFAYIIPKKVKIKKKFTPPPPKPPKPAGKRIIFDSTEEGQSREKGRSLLDSEQAAVQVGKAGRYKCTRDHSFLFRVGQVLPLCPLPGCKSKLKPTEFAN